MKDSARWYELAVSVWNLGQSFKYLDDQCEESLKSFVGEELFSFPSLSKAAARMSHNIAVSPVLAKFFSHLIAEISRGSLSDDDADDWRKVAQGVWNIQEAQQHIKTCPEAILAGPRRSQRVSKRRLVGTQSTHRWARSVCSKGTFDRGPPPAGEDF